MMKISKLEYVSIIICVALLAFGAGWFTRGSTVASPVQIETQYVVENPTVVTTTQPTASQNPDEEQAASPAVVVAEDAVLLVNINTADVDELQKLPNIGEKRAEDIVAYREEHGAFGMVEELTNVSGIGEGILEDMMDYITVE